MEQTQYLVPLKIHVAITHLHNGLTGYYIGTYPPSTEIKAPDGYLMLQDEHRKGVVQEDLIHLKCA